MAVVSAHGRSRIPAPGGLKERLLVAKASPKLDDHVPPETRARAHAARAHAARAHAAGGLGERGGRRGRTILAGAERTQFGRVAIRRATDGRAGGCNRGGRGGVAKVPPQAKPTPRPLKGRSRGATIPSEDGTVSNGSFACFVPIPKKWGP
jgi:hypothetical protein